MVGNDQANEPWLDEAVTQYVTGLYYLDIYGQQGMDDYRATWVSRWDRMNRQAIPISLPAGAYKGREYGAIVYGRGLLFLDALAKRMGQGTFDRFLRDYNQTNEWGIATAASFKTLAAPWQGRWPWRSLTQAGSLLCLGLYAILSGGPHGKFYPRFPQFPWRHVWTAIGARISP